MGTAENKFVNPSRDDEAAVCPRVDGTCVCDAGMATGKDCSVALCPDFCNGKGSCNSVGQCECVHGYGGDTCLEKATCKHLNSCNGHGSCKDSKCVCDKGYDGEDCSRKKCP